MQPTSLIGLAVARDLIEDLTDSLLQGRRVAHISRGNVSMSARVTDHGTTVVWGHIANEKAYSYGTVRSNEIPRTYIKSKDERRSINRLVTLALRRVAQERPLHEAREALCKLADTRKVPESWQDNPPLQRTMDYSSMTLEDVAAWTPLVEALEVIK